MNAPLDRIDSLIEVEYNVFTLASTAGEPGSAERPYENGIVTAATTGDGTAAVIVTGLVDGDVHVVVERWTAEAPMPDLDDWQDTAEVEISWPGGPARILGADVVPLPELLLAQEVPPGRYLLRVAGRHRDDGEARLPGAPVEEYLLQLWPSNHAARGSLKATSRLGALWRQGPP